MKVGKEELVGFLRALELFVEEDDDVRLAEYQAHAEKIATRLDDNEFLSVEIGNGEKTSAVSEVAVSLDESRAGVRTAELVKELR